MFTGIVEEIGRVAAVEHREVLTTLVTESRQVHEGAQLGDSIAVNGVCLTVVAIAPNRGPAVSAQRLYSESEESVAARAALNEARSVAPEPASGRRGRPTKQDRRQIQRLRAS